MLIKKTKFWNNTLIYGATMANVIERDGRPKRGTVINGLYNEDDKEVSIQYTENPDDVFMKGTEFEMIGWKQLGKAKPDPTPSMGSTIEIYNKKDNSMQKTDLRELVLWALLLDSVILQQRVLIII